MDSRIHWGAVLLRKESAKCFEKLSISHLGAVLEKVVRVRLILNGGDEKDDIIITSLMKKN